MFNDYLIWAIAIATLILTASVLIVADTRRALPKLEGVLRNSRLSPLSGGRMRTAEGSHSRSLMNQTPSDKQSAFNTVRNVSRVRNVQYNEPPDVEPRQRYSPPTWERLSHAN